RHRHSIKKKTTDCCYTALYSVQNIHCKERGLVSPPVLILLVTMMDEVSKKNKFSWSKSLVRKWFSMKSKREEFQTDKVSEREPPAIKKTKTEKSSKSRRSRVDLEHPQIINVHNYSIFAATWNVGGKSPSSNMNLDDWLHAAPQADIYVL
ncbi:hypothetical protein M8C21_001407, partial [Ambrosia artemisiifolia]